MGRNACIGIQSHKQKIMFVLRKRIRALSEYAWSTTHTKRIHEHVVTLTSVTEVITDTENGMTRSAANQLCTPTHCKHADDCIYQLLF